jgi:diguanylate cyclase (GGDEF)-like protein
MFSISYLILALAETLEQRWETYRERGDFDQFVEFTLSLNGLTEQLNNQQLPGLVRACQELENTALSLFATPSAHPIPVVRANAMERQLNVILRELRQHETPAVMARRGMDRIKKYEDTWNRPRKVMIVSRINHPWMLALSEQLSFFGFFPEELRWGAQPTHHEPPLATIFIPDYEGKAYSPQAVAGVMALRAHFPTSYFYCLSVPADLQSIVLLQRAGADACVPASKQISDLLSRILDMVDTREQDIHRVLVVEDSATAVAHIRRSLWQYGIDSRAISDPRNLLDAAVDYRPDAILMDIYMPFCSGVEVTSALRQIPEYQSIPVIYLSSETDLAQQVEALRLGGDQFLTKPVNPIILASVVKTKIERYREMLYSGRHDGLTGLLNHSTSKLMLDHMLKATSTNGQLVVAMIDIDHFKSINDNFGHPLGDQVIRSLAWLLRGRLRNTDLIGRYGGEEFIIALADADLVRATSLLETIREAFSNLPQNHAQGSVHATFSCGVAALPHYCTVSDLIGGADEALLVAKRQGRNQMVLAPLLNT